MSRAEQRQRAAAEAAAGWAATLGRGGRVEIGLRRGRLVRLLVVSAVFVALGAIMFLAADDASQRAVGGACVVFFGLGIVVFARQLTQVGVEVVVDDVGVEMPRWSLRVPWSAVTGADVFTVQRTRLVQLLVDPAFHEQWFAEKSRFQGGVARANRALLGGAHALSLPGSLDVDEDAFARWLCSEAQARAPR